MAKELSQAELLDFLCQSGGRVANAALVGHFRRFLRDAHASPDELQRRRERFKGFVNAVATVRHEGAPGGGGGGAKFVVLKKRYRELVGEEPRAPGDHQAPPDELRPGGRRPGGEPPRAPGPEEERPCRGPARLPSGARAAREELPADPGGRSPPPPPPPPPLPRRPAVPGEPCALLGGAEKRGHAERRPPPAGDGRLLLRGGAPPSPDPPSPPGQIPGVPPSAAASAQQRIREWLAGAGTHADERRSPLAGAPPSPSPSRGPSTPGSCPSPSLEGGRRRPQVPVFRSIRCQLSLQDLEDFIEQASSGSEEGGSSASGGSDSHRCEGGLPIRPGTQNGTPGRSPRDAPRKPEAEPRANGQLVPLTQERLVQGHGAVRQPPQPYGGNSGRPLPWEKPPDSVGQTKEPPKARKVAKMSPPSLVAPLSSQLEPQQGGSTSALDLDGPDPDGTLEPRSSSVPLEPREHAWLVKVAAGSWMQARALLLEDPHLATQRDFVSGYTVLHWLAKHGNAQALQDFVAGAHEAGVALDVNVKSGCGYTPLHLAAMHGHQRVIKLLVHRLRCETQVRDCSGKKPWQYLSSSTSGEVWQLLGAPRGKTIFPARPLTRNPTMAGTKGRSPELVRKISRKVSLAAYLKPQHIKWKMGNRCPPLPEND